MPNQKAPAEKKAFVYEKYMIGIDPVEINHQAAARDSPIYFNNTRNQQKGTPFLP